MKSILIPLFILFILSGCHKDRVKPDNIIYHKFVPPIQVIAVSSWNNSSFDLCDYPIFSDSSGSVSIDIDSDAINDFKIFYNGNYSPACYGQRCNSYWYDIGIMGLNSIDSVYGIFFEDTINNTISPKCKWNKQLGQVFLTAPCANAIDFLQYPYVGIRLNDKFGWIHFAPIRDKGVEIVEYALNLTANNSIKAGQKE